MSITAEQYKDVLTAAIVSSCISIISDIILFIKVFRAKDYYKLSTRLFLYLAGCDFIAILSYLIGLAPGACILEGVLKQLFYLSSFLWTFFIAFNLFATVVLQKTPNYKWEISYNCIVWTISITVVAVAGAQQAFGPAGAWCWILESHENIRLTHYSFLIIIIFFDAILYFFVYREVKKIMEQSKSDTTKHIEQRRETKIQRKFIFIVLGFLILRIPSLINRFTEFATGITYYPIYQLQGTTDPLLGFSNVIIYTFSYKSFKKFCAQTYSQIRDRIPCCVKPRSISEISLESSSPKSPKSSAASDTSLPII